MSQQDLSTKIGVRATPVAIFLFFVFLASFLAGVYYLGPTGAAVCALAITLIWLVLGRICCTLFDGCYFAAYGRKFGDITGYSRNLERNRQSMRAACMIAWPIFIGICCPVLLLSSLIRVLWRN